MCKQERMQKQNLSRAPEFLRARFQIAHVALLGSSTRAFDSSPLVFKRRSLRHTDIAVLKLCR